MTTELGYKVKSLIKRWYRAQEQEKQYRNSLHYTPESIESAKILWGKLINWIKSNDIPVDKLTRFLDVGSAGTSIFLTIQHGVRYAVDPMLEHILKINPFLSELDAYREVKFISSPFEDLELGVKFDIIFLINVLDHTHDPRAVIEKAKELLCRNGYLILAIDTYHNTKIKNTIKFFDPDPAHLQHFDRIDLNRLLKEFTIVAQINGLYPEPETTSPNNSLLSRIINLSIPKILSYLRRIGFYYSVRHIVCYLTLIGMYLLRLIPAPVEPLKKMIVYISKKEI